MTIRQKTFIEANSGKMTISELGKAIGLPAQTVSDAISRSGLERKRTPATFDDAMPGGKQMRVMDVLKSICQKPQTIKELAAELSVDPRSIYRYMALLVDIGADVQMTKDGKYFLNECPICNKRL